MIVRTIRFVLIASAAFGIALLPTIAEAADLGDLINCEKTRPHSREYRKGLGIEFARQLKALDSAIPSPSPDDLAWLESERQRVIGRNARELADIFSSRPSLLRQAKDGLQNQLLLARCIIEDPKREMTCFAKLSHELMNSGATYEAVGQLARKSQIVVTKDSGVLGMTLADFDHEFWPRVIGLGVVSCILTPYIESEERRR